MAGEAVKKSPYAAGLPNAYRVGIINLAAGSLCTMLAALAGGAYAVGFAAGYLLGFINLLWLFRIIKRALKMPRERVVRYVAIRYYMRFVLTAGVLFFIISERLVEKPWPVVAGITLSIFAALGSMIVFAKEELR